MIFENLSEVRMKHSTGFLKVVFTWMVILMQSLDAGHPLKKHAMTFSCKPRELTNLTKRLVEASLASFDEANGRHLGTWSPGFPELQVNQNTSLNGSIVQCSLFFTTQGLEKILEDQRKNLNPQDVSLHKELRETISTVNSLRVCVKEIHGGECSPKPSPPKMPTHAFERKQWSHTLLKTARDYLSWLGRKVGEGRKRAVTEAARHRHLEGSAHLL